MGMTSDLGTTTVSPHSAPAPSARDWAALAVLTLVVALLAVDSTVLAPSKPSTGMWWQQMWGSVGVADAPAEEK